MHACMFIIDSLLLSYVPIVKEEQNDGGLLFCSSFYGVKLAKVGKVFCFFLSTPLQCHSGTNERKSTKEGLKRIDSA